jgi:putative ABC transport system permease protein
MKPLILVKGALARMRPAWRVLWRSQQLEHDMRDEISFHIEMEAERLARQEGLDPEAARRLAYVRFGGVEKYKEAGRDARGRQWIDALSIDTRLSLRMLVKYRGLTLIGGFAMAVAIAIGATAFEAIGEMLTPALPFEDGARIVSLQYAASNPANRRRDMLRDFAHWREELTSIEDLGAFRTVQHNLASPYAPPEPVKLAEMTASGFAVARTPPLLGRYLLPSDEQAAATPVVVVGYQAWHSRFAANPQIVGRSITLSGVPHTVVGVMPAGFGFPFDHHFWIPFRTDSLAPLIDERFEGPSIYLFGRLAPGVTIEQAQAELTTMAPRKAADRAEGQGALRAVVVPYTRDHVDLSDPGMVVLFRIAQVLTGALVFVVAVNLAILVYARTVTRFGEIAVRAALGASRRRILVQLFIEALALSALGALSGLALSAVALNYLQSLARSAGGVPFWIRFELSPATVFSALALAVVAAVIMGVLPGLKATGRLLNVHMNELNGRSGTRLGALWTTLVVAQVAVAVAVLPVACYMTWQMVLLEMGGPGFAAEKFAVSLLAVPEPIVAADPNRITRAQVEMMSRLQTEPGVTAVTFSSYVPGFAGGARIQFEDRVAPTAPAPWDVSRMKVAIEMLDVYGAEIVAGRRFVSSDLRAANTVIVNQTFARWLSGDGQALGVRFHYAEVSGQAVAHRDQFEIIGVVRDFPNFPHALNLDTPAVVYHPAAVGDVNPAFLSVRFNTSMPAGFTRRVRQIGVEADPALQLRTVLRLSDYYDQVMSLWRYISWGIGLVTLSVLLLSAAGMYALMSFTVAQRTREIGIRLALGARPRGLLVSVFKRALRQIALGIGVGAVASGLLISAAGLNPMLATGLLVSVATIMLTVGLLAAFGPARQSLRIHVADVLRTDT